MIPEKIRRAMVALVSYGHPKIVQISYLRMGLGREIGNVRLARRVQQDGFAGLGRHLEDRQEARLIQAGAVYIGVELQSIGVAVEEYPFGLLDRRVGCVHR